MIQTGSLAIGVVLVIVVLAWMVRRVRGGSTSTMSAEERESYDRHRQAQQREPPVDIGDERTAAIEEFSTHHSGARRAVCKVEGFVVFVEDVPDGLDATDVITLKILSFNRGHTSARATFVGRA